MHGNNAAQSLVLLNAIREKESAEVLGEMYVSQSKGLLTVDHFGCSFYELYRNGH